MIKKQTATQSHAERQKRSTKPKPAAKPKAGERMLLKNRPPTHFQLTQLTATLATASNASKSPVDLVEDAIRLWEASGRALLLSKHTDNLVEGLLCFTEQEWNDHCNNLIAMLDESNYSVKGTHYRDWANDAFLSVFRAADLVQQRWSISRCALRDSFLEALFPRKSETTPSRLKKLKELIDYLRTQLQESDTTVVSGLDTWSFEKMEQSMLKTWSPLHFHDENEEYREFIEEAWDWLNKPDDSLYKIFRLAPMVRWLAVMQMRKLSDSKVRPPRPTPNITNRT